MKIIITGATGFIGSYVVRHLLREGHELYCAIRDGSNLSRLSDITDEIFFFTVDYTDLSGWAERVPCARIDGFIHLGWTGVAGSKRNDISQVDNIKVSAALVLIAKELGGKFFLSTGSQAEYGPHSGALNENCVETPTTLYGKSKLATKQICEHLCAEHSMRFTWVRVFSTYGPRDNEWWMIPSLIKSISQHEVPPLTLGDQKWDFLHVSDAAAAIVGVALCERAEGVFNLGSGQSPQLKTTIKMIRDYVRPGAALGFGEIAYRKDQVMHLEADVSKLRRVVGWEPKVNIQDGLRATVDWFCADDK
jgi:nucleoside-diphosphate-sugar epimerase